MGRLLVFVGLGVVGVGLLIMAGFPFGRLPGDVVFRRGNFAAYVPMTTSIVVSVVLTLLLALVRR